MIGASVIIPVYNAFRFARPCIESVYEARVDTPFEVIVIDNGSTPEVGAWLAQKQREYPCLVVLHFDRPLGFARAVNEGARRAQHDSLVLLNSDTRVTDGWLDRLTEASERDSQFGVLSPLSNHAGSPLQVEPGTERFDWDQCRSFAAAIRDRKGLILEPEWLSFFCVMISRCLWESLEGLDEIYGAGNAEDRDFCLQARLKGYRLAIVRSAFVFHDGGQATFRDNGLDRDAWLRRNRSLYYDRTSRWSRLTNLSHGKPKNLLPIISVIVPAKTGQALQDSLASLTNQTVGGFETIVTSAGDEALSDIVRRFQGLLQISEIAVDVAFSNHIGVLLNAGLAEAKRHLIAYLPAGDIYYPFHLELLAKLLGEWQVEAVHSAWSAVGESDDTGSEVQIRRVADPYQAPPGQLGLNNYPPLSCWMHSRTQFSVLHFDESFPAFADWEFVLRMGRSLSNRYLPSVTCERRTKPNQHAPAPAELMEAERLLQSFSASQSWQQENRDQFLEAVKQGNSNVFPLLSSAHPAVTAGQKSETVASLGSANKFQTCLVHPARDTYRSLVPLKTRYEIEWWTRRFLGLRPIPRTDSQKLHAATNSLKRATCNTKLASGSTTVPDIFFFSAVPWNHLVQRPHHFARELALRGHRVFWVDLRLQPAERVDPVSLVREIESGIFYVGLPATVPELYQLKWNANAVGAMETAIAHIRAAFGVQNAIQFVNRPKWTPLLFRLRNHFGWPIVYDCVDDTKAFAALNGHDGGDMEDELTKRCDLLVACSRLLFEDRRRFNCNSVCILNAGDYSLFHSAKASGLLRDLPRPIIGFFGALSDWLDLEWIEQAARRFPKWSFVFVGRSGFAIASKRERWKILGTTANIHIFPQAAPFVLASYLAEFDVCTMPFENLPMTRIMNAVKIYEYLAAGKPVVLPEHIAELQPLADRGLIETYANYEQSFQLLDNLVHHFQDRAVLTERLDFASQNTWSRRVDELVVAFSRLGYSRLNSAVQTR